MMAVNNRVVFIYVLIAKSVLSCPEIELKTVVIENGPIFGKIQSLESGREFYSYRGIPFAKPPVEGLRFKNPVKPDSWTQPLDATEEGPYCIQINYLFANPIVEGVEDCLYLNVYVPKTHHGNKLPVMVNFHWGGFFAGKGTSDFQGPEYFMEKDVILVTFNYRLGIFGFLTTLDDAAPGNYGLKDQRLVLRWVQDNIHHFDGNNDLVTIFGQSAGGGSVHYHMISPLSKGLFHRAISQSGSALSLWAAIGNSIQKNIFNKQATLVGCQGFLGNSTAAIDCLRNVSANALLESQQSFKIFDVNPLNVYQTVAETKSEANDEPFFTKSPLEYILAKELLNVPWLTGVVADEGLIKVAGLLQQTSLRNQLNANFDFLVRDVLLTFSLSSATPNVLFNNVIDTYMEGDHYVNISNPKRIRGFSDLYSDRFVTYYQYQSAMLHSIKGHEPIWFYLFDYRGEYTFADVFAATHEKIDFQWGPSHCDELIYLFKSPGIFPPLKQQSDLDMRKLMIDLWYNFAVYGNPNGIARRPLKFEWKPLDLSKDDYMKSEKLCYLSIKGNNHPFNVSQRCGFERKRMTFWSKQSLFENVDID